MGGCPKIRNTLLGGPHNKDYNMLGSPYLGKLPFQGLCILRNLNKSWRLLYTAINVLKTNPKGIGGLRGLHKSNCLRLHEDYIGVILGLYRDYGP